MWLHICPCSLVTFGSSGTQKQEERHYLGTNPFGWPLIVIMLQGYHKLHALSNSQREQQRSASMRALPLKDAAIRRSRCEGEARGNLLL